MIAMALSCNPRLLIADEPTTALDVTIQAQIVELVLRLQGEFHMAIIWITHDLGVVARLADRVVVMYAGRVVEEATVDEVFDNPRHPYTLGTAWLGSPTGRGEAGPPPARLRACPRTYRRSPTRVRSSRVVDSQPHVVVRKGRSWPRSIRPPGKAAHLAAPRASVGTGGSCVSPRR